jgi:GNAT superfamily N-acetyltransferase
MANDILFREATAADIPGISRVRTAVTENALTLEQLAARGVTNKSIAVSFLQHSKGWVAIRGDEIVGFSIGDRTSGSIFALFVLPGHELQGIGARLFDLAVNWLWQNGAARIWLTSDPRSKAARFYERRGWVATGRSERGDMRYEIGRQTRGE